MKWLPVEAMDRSLQTNRQRISDKVQARRQWVSDKVAALPAAGLLSRGVEWLYDRAVAGAPGLDGAHEMAAEYLARHGNPEAAIDAMINWQTGKAGMSGFVTGLGGVLTLPFSIPANLASTIYIQLRLIAAIAHLRGHDIDSEKVRATAFACLSSATAAEKVKKGGADLGILAARHAVGRIHNNFVQKQLGRCVPVIGGLVAGGFDAATTRVIGHAAKRLFPPTPVIDAETQV